MSTKVTLAENNKVYTDYDSLGGIQWCTPSFLGCNACVSVTASGSSASLTISVNTPFGSWSKTFSVSGPITFTWQPYSRFKVVVAISNYQINSGNISFDLRIDVCIDMPIFGWKCAGYSHHFGFPTETNVSALGQLSDAEFSNLLIMHHLLGEENGCSCKGN